MWIVRGQVVRKERAGQVRGVGNPEGELPVIPEEERILPWRQKGRQHSCGGSRCC